jgi:3-hydroxy-9,10-secoandrosta-1,3,5(10)-triene-9,17-dione monooxygenase reductase component
MLHAMAACKAIEDGLIGRLGEHEAGSFRNLLKRVIIAIDPGLPKVWLANHASTN